MLIDDYILIVGFVSVILLVIITSDKTDKEIKYKISNLLKNFFNK